MSLFNREPSHRVANNRLIELEQHQNWRCYVDASQAQWVAELPTIAELLRQLTHLETSLKDNHRSQVRTGKLCGKVVVAKQPRNKNRHWWARILTLFEASEAMATHLSLARFQAHNIPAGTPLLVLEKRAFAMVVDSWVCYEYRAGEPSSKADLPEILELLKAIHQADMQHKDPNLGNFLRAPNGELFLIDCRGRKRQSHFSDTNDYLLLQSLNPSLADFNLAQVSYLQPHSWGYKMAIFYQQYKQVRTRLKHKLKPQRRRNRD